MLSWLPFRERKSWKATSTWTIPSIAGHSNFHWWIGVRAINASICRCWVGAGASSVHGASPAGQGAGAIGPGCPGTIGCCRKLWLSATVFAKLYIYQLKVHLGSFPSCSFGCQCYFLNRVGWDTSLSQSLFLARRWQSRHHRRSRWTRRQDLGDTKRIKAIA